MWYWLKYINNNKDNITHSTTTDLALFDQEKANLQYRDVFRTRSLHKKWRNPQSKTSFFVQWVKHFMMKLYVKLVNSFQGVTIFAKNIYVCLVRKYTSKLLSFVTVTVSLEQIKFIPLLIISSILNICQQQKFTVILWKTVLKNFTKFTGKNVSRVCAFHFVEIHYTLLILSNLLGIIIMDIDPLINGSLLLKIWDLCACATRDYSLLHTP